MSKNKVNKIIEMDNEVDIATKKTTDEVEKKELVKKVEEANTKVKKAEVEKEEEKKKSNKIVKNTIIGALSISLLFGGVGLIKNPDFIKNLFNRNNNTQNVSGQENEKDKDDEDRKDKDETPSNIDAGEVIIGEDSNGNSYRMYKKNGKVVIDTTYKSSRENEVKSEEESNPVGTVDGQMSEEDYKKQTEEEINKAKEEGKEIHELNDDVTGIVGPDVEETKPENNEPDLVTDGKNVIHMDEEKTNVSSFEDEKTEEDFADIDFDEYQIGD